MKKLLILLILGFTVYWRMVGGTLTNQTFDLVGTKGSFLYCYEVKIFKKLILIIPSHRIIEVKADGDGYKMED